MCADTCVGMCTDMCVDICVDLCVDMCRDMCVGMCIVSRGLLFLAACRQFVAHPVGVSSGPGALSKESQSKETYPVATCDA